MQIKGLLCCLTVIFLTSCANTRIKEHSEWKKYFEEQGIKSACFEMRDNNHESVHFYNRDRCVRRFLPASTFKIFNSLVALETAIAPDDQLVIKWDSVVRDRPELNKDMTMREAFKVSSLPYFQEIARRIGPERMKHFLDTVKYGNTTMSGGVDSFWINNSLQISADEQIGLLKKMYFFELPFSERTQRIVKNMMLREEDTGYNLYYKTGTGRVGDVYVYWIVGFVEKVEHVKEPEGSMNKADFRNYPYFFAQNFEVPVSDTSHDWFKVRVEILHGILKEYGAIPK